MNSCACINGDAFKDLAAEPCTATNKNSDRHAHALGMQPMKWNDWMTELMIITNCSNSISTVAKDVEGDLTMHR